MLEESMGILLRESGREIDCGSGKPVTDEAIGDAGEPLRIEWCGDPYIDFPIRR